MSEEAEGLYFADRLAAEQAMIQRATDRRAAEAHRELAEHYEALAVVFGAKAPSPGTYR